MFALKFESLSSSFLLKTACLLLFIQCCLSLPVDTPYSAFVADMTGNNCTLPSQIPISYGANETTIEASLQVCNTPGYLKFNKEVPVLCKEIFDLLRNISCSPQIASLPKIQVILSNEVCTSFAIYKTVLPEGLLRHLSDSFNCKMLCSDDFEAPCKVLLWSFLVQDQLKSVETHELLNTKSTSITETNVELKLQPIPHSTESKDGKSPDTQDDLGTSGNKNDVVQGFDRLSNLNSNKHKAVGNDNTKSDIVSPAKIVRKTEKENSGVEQEKDKADVLKIKDIIPVKLNVNVHSDQDKTGDTNINSLESNNLPKLDSKLSQDLKVSPSDTVKNPNALISKVTDSEISNNAAEIDVKNDAGKPEILEPENIVPAKEVSSVKAVQGDDTNYGKPQTDQKLDDSEKKQDDTAASGKVTVDPPSEEPPVANVSPAVSVSISENIPSPTSVVPMAVTPSLEKMDEIPPPNGKESDQYNDLDNADGDLDGEYSKQEYGDGGMYEPTKGKESVSEKPKVMDIPKEPVVPQSEDTKGFNGLSQRDSFGQGSDEIQVLAPFPEQEDSHFFFYFLSIVLILMAGYLLFHNKQKIIALIVEGRHERRRRSHGLGYKKLETK